MLPEKNEHRSYPPSHSAPPTTKMISVASSTAPVRVTARPTSAKKPRAATVVRATQDSNSEPEAPERSEFWSSVFLNGKEEVKASDYQKFQAELKAQKEANKKAAAEKEKACVLM